MSNRTQEEGRSYYTEHTYDYTPSGNLFRDANNWQRGLLWATRVCDPTYDRICDLPPVAKNPIIAIYSYAPNLQLNRQVLSDFGGSCNWEVYGDILNYNPETTYSQVVINDGLDEVRVDIEADGTFYYVAEPPMSDDLNGTITVRADCSCMHPITRDWMPSNTSETEVDFIIKALVPQITNMTPQNDTQFIEGMTLTFTGELSWSTDNEFKEFTTTYNSVDVTPSISFIEPGKATYTVEIESDRIVLGANTIDFHLAVWNPDNGGEDSKAESDLSHSFTMFQATGGIAYELSYPRATQVNVDSRVIFGMIGSVSNGMGTTYPLTVADVAEVRVILNDGTQVPNVLGPDKNKNTGFCIQMSGYYFSYGENPIKLEADVRVPGTNGIVTFTNNWGILIGLTEKPNSFTFAISPQVVWLDGNPEPVPSEIVITGDLQDLQYANYDNQKVSVNLTTSDGTSETFQADVDQWWPASFRLSIPASKFPTDTFNSVVTMTLEASTSNPIIPATTVTSEIPFFKTVPAFDVTSFETGDRTDIWNMEEFNPQTEFDVDGNIIFKIDGYVPTKRALVESEFYIERANGWDWDPVAFVERMDVHNPEVMSQAAEMSIITPAYHKDDSEIPFDGGTYRLKAQTRAVLGNDGNESPEPAQRSDWTVSGPLQYDIFDDATFKTNTTIAIDWTKLFAAITPDTDDRQVGPPAISGDTFRPGEFQVMVDMQITKVDVDSDIRVLGMQLCEDTPTGINLLGGDSLVSTNGDTIAPRFGIQFFSHEAGKEIKPFTTAKWVVPSTTLKFCILLSDNTDPGNVKYFYKYITTPIPVTNYPGPVEFSSSTGEPIRITMGDTNAIVIDTKYTENPNLDFDSIVKVTATDSALRVHDITDGSWIDKSNQQISIYAPDLVPDIYELYFELNFFNYVDGQTTYDCDHNGGRICKNPGPITMIVEAQ